MIIKKTAILVDAGFFLHRYRYLRGKQTAERAAQDLHRLCLLHLTEYFGTLKKRHALYRIFIYDCPPLSKKAHNPCTNRAIDFSRTEQAKFRNDFHQALRKKRNLALRLGYLDERNAGWSLRPKAMKDVLSGKRLIDDLDSETDIFYDVRQKSVDMKLGLDIASLAFKRQVDRIVLISGDSDFVPAAKLARREGIDFILDPMWADIRSDLYEHIDGLRSTISRRSRRQGERPQEQELLEPEVAG